MKNTRLISNLTFTGYLFSNLIFRMGDSVSKIKQESIKDNDPEKATASDRAAALMSNGLFSALTGIAIAIISASIYVLLNLDSTTFLWLTIIPGITLLFNAAWYYIRLFPAEQAYKQWKLDGWEKDDIADESLFVSNAEFIVVAIVSLLLATAFATALFGLPL